MTIRMRLVSAFLTLGLSCPLVADYTPSNEQAGTELLPPEVDSQFPELRRISESDEAKRFEITLDAPQTDDERRHDLGIESQNLRLYRMAMEELRKKEETLPREDLLEEIDQGLKVEINGVGEAKISLVGGLYVVRVLLDQYQLAILNIDFTRVKVLSEEMQGDFSNHYDVFVARQKINSKRDVLTTDIDSELFTVKNYQFSARAPLLSAQWWRDFWYSIKAMPTPGDWIAGPVWGFYQGGFTLGMKMFQDGTTVAETWNNHYDKIALITGFGMTVGVFCTMYRNLINTGDTQAQRMARSWFVGGSFAFAFVGMEIAHRVSLHGWDSFSVLGLLATMAGVTIHVTYQQFTKDEWNVTSRVNTILRRLRGNVEVLGIDTKVKKRNFENQAIYNFFQVPLKLFDLANVSIAGVVPLGRAMFYASPIPIRAFGLWWTKCHLTKAVAEYDADPKNAHKRRVVENVLQQVKEARDRWRTVTNIFKYSKNFLTNPIGSLQEALNPTNIQRGLSNGAVGLRHAIFGCPNSFRTTVDEKLLRQELSKPLTVSK